MTNKIQIGPMLRLVLAMGRLAAPLARPILKRRLARGKEDPKRWQEKLGQASAARPDGPLVWLHGVGVGEVMALRGLIEQMSATRPDLSFLVTSSARSSGDVFAKNLPARTQHQYLPLDLPGPVAAFLTHWKPDLAVWSDQEVWPRLTVEVARRAIPQAYVAARITEASAKAKQRFGGTYGDLYRLMNTRHAQDETTSAALRELMNDDTPVHVTGSIKAAGPPLASDARVRQTFETIAAHRRMWLLASSHSADEIEALEAHKRICAQDADALLIIAPREVARADDLANQSAKAGFATQRRSDAPIPDASTNVYIANTYGELGAWYAAAPIALIGGTFDATEGHNPWEAVALDCAVMHGPRVANFSKIYGDLDAQGAARLVHNAAEIATALLDPAMADVARRASDVRDQASEGLERVTTDLIALLKV